jgi:hypothetical protein
VLYCNWEFHTRQCIYAHKYECAENYGQMQVALVGSQQIMNAIWVGLVYTKLLAGFMPIKDS